MTKRKNNKRALTFSLLSLLLCVSMLVGSTFAWFTDSASTGVNKIVAGNLDIDLIDANGDSLDKKTIGFADKDNNNYWEPGCRYTLNEVKLINKGNLNAKYKVVISTATGNLELANVIDVYEGQTKLGTLNNFLNDALGIKEGVIAPGETLSFGTLTLVMQETAGNEYMNKTIENIAITVYATQATVESDSFDNLFDKDAVYDDEVGAGDQDDLEDAIEDGAVISLSAGTYNLTELQGQLSGKTVTFKGNEDGVIIDATGLGNELYSEELTFRNVTINFPDVDHRGITHTQKLKFIDCTFSGTQTLYAPLVEFENCKFEGNGTKDIYYVWTYGVANATFKDCTFTTGGKAILCYQEGTIENANVTLENCKFTSDGSVSSTKACVEVGTDNHAQKYNLTFKNCEQTGFSTNKSTDPLWGNKNDMTQEELNVVINGIDVY